MRPESSEPSLNDNAGDALIARPDDALIAHYQSPPKARRWPLWLCILLLGSIVGWQQWQLQGLEDTGGNQRDRLTSRVTEIERAFDNSAQDNAKAQVETSSRIDSLSQQWETAVLPALAKIRQANAALVDEAADRHAQVQQQLAVFDQRLSERGADMADLSATLDTLKASAAEARQSGENRQTLLTALQGSVSAIESLGRDGRAVLKTRLDSQADALTHLEEVNVQTDQQLSRIAEQLEALAGKVEQYADRLDSLASEHGESGEGVVALKRELTRELTALRARLASQQQLLDRFDKTLDTQSNAVAGVDSTAVNRLIEARVSPLAKAQTSLESQVGDLRRQQTALSAGLEAQGQSDGSSDQLRSLDASRRQLSGRVASLLGQMSELQQRVTRLER
ncbi:hypothetical protein [Cobetia crustatorum]|uniref:Uncharacterized protein n=1 Tax=Cobetia crustatorum TaxID=553385 RepID=A0A558HKU9_9GAMM|nr:hypothetical protein [Cobetia crustatorum]TVU69688.1 hypothetical protein FQP86_11325 [Cobetia crustatorum]